MALKNAFMQSGTDVSNWQNHKTSLGASALNAGFANVAYFFSSAR